MSPIEALAESSEAVASVEQVTVVRKDPNVRVETRQQPRKPRNPGAFGPA